MTPLILLLTVFVAALVAGLAVYAAAYLTAESEFFRPLRERVRKEAQHHANVQRWAEAHDLRDWEVRVVERVTNWFADLIECPYCTSWWHAVWLVAMIGVVAGIGFKLTLLSYLPAVGVAVIITKLTESRAAQQPPATTLREMLKRAG